MNGAREGKAGLQSFFMTLLVMLPAVGVPHAVLSSPPRLSAGRTCSATGSNTTYQYLQSRATRVLLARCRAPSFASATEKSRAAAVVQPACPKLGLVVYGTSIDRWCASESKTGSDGDGVAVPALPFALADCSPSAVSISI